MNTTTTYQSGRAIRVPVYSQSVLLDGKTIDVDYIDNEGSPWVVAIRLNGAEISEWMQPELIERIEEQLTNRSALVA